jgi:hypothetical protein
LIATAAEIPPVVTDQFSLSSPFCSYRFCVLGVHSFGCEWYFLLSLIYPRTSIDHRHPRNVASETFVRFSLTSQHSRLLLFFSIQMFQPPSWIAMAIAATRMHRSLVDYASRLTDVYDVLFSLALSCSLGSIFSSARDNIKHDSPPVPATTRTSSHMELMEVSVHVVSEQHGTPSMRDDELCISTSDETYDKPKESNRDDDVERGVRE